MTEQWIQGCVVQRIAFRDGLVLNLDDYNELDVFVPLTLTLPATNSDDAEVVTIDPTAIRDEERPLFDFAGSMCTHADWDDDGSLHLRFSDGHEIEVHSDEHRTAWELYGKYHGYAACLPHGQVRIVRTDVPEDESASADGYRRSVARIWVNRNKPVPTRDRFVGPHLVADEPVAILDRQAIGPRRRTDRAPALKLLARPEIPFAVGDGHVLKRQSRRSRQVAIAGRIDVNERRDKAVEPPCPRADFDRPTSRPTPSWPAPPRTPPESTPDRPDAPRMRSRPAPAAARGPNATH